jgi:exosome complex RNA-binding protein Rrp42 (RNase PH superfamily)
MKNKIKMQDEIPKYCLSCEITTKHVLGVCQLCVAKIGMQLNLNPFDDSPEEGSLDTNREIDRN